MMQLFHANTEGTCVSDVEKKTFHLSTEAFIRLIGFWERFSVGSWLTALKNRIDDHARVRERMLRSLPTTRGSTRLNFRYLL